MNIDQEFRNLIPPLSKEEFEQLEQNIISEGCRDAIVIWNGIILDGHNRYEICSNNDIEFKTIEMNFYNRDDAMDWMDKNQLGRRNLTPDQRKIIIGRRYNREKMQGKRNDLTCDQIDHKLTSDQRKIIIGRRYNRDKFTHGGDRKSSGKNYHTGRTSEILAVENKISSPTVRRYAKEAEIFDKIKDENPELANKVWSGELTINEVKREEKQQKLEQKKAEYNEKIENIDSESINIFNTEKKYRIIYADPPWSYNDKQDTPNLGGAIKHYKALTIDEIGELPIKNLTEENSVLFLWVTSPFLEDSFKIIKDWGFKYKSSFIWDKVNHNMGHYNSVRHEFLLIATKGSCTPDNKNLYDSVQSVEKTEHSKKPYQFIDIIDDLYCWGDRIELFARESINKNWDYWGNEV